MSYRRYSASETQEKAMKKNKIIKRYFSGEPTKPGPGRVIVHNHVMPQIYLGINGFRAWTQRPDKSIEVCKCDWAGVNLPVKVHYRVHLSFRRLGLKACSRRQPDFSLQET
jgi:hypothetical protein